MFVFQIKELLIQKGVLRPFAQLRKMGVPYNRANTLIQGKARVVYLDDLYKFCTYLNCTPKELLRVQLPPNSPPLDDSPLHDWLLQENINLMQELITLKPDQMQRIEQLVKEMKGANTTNDTIIKTNEENN